MAFSYKEYEESDAVRAARAALAAQQQAAPQSWDGGSYGEAVKAALEKLQNREAFRYDMNADALYNQYKDNYIRQGKLAMADTVGKAAALTGGYGNSYAVTAGSEAYGNALQSLNDTVPQLYALAYGKYTDDTAALQDNAKLLQQSYNTEYGAYRDTLEDWQAKLNRLAEEVTAAEQTDYDRYADGYDRAFKAYQQQVKEEQAANQLAAEQAAAAAKAAATAAKTASAAKAKTTVAATEKQALSELPKSKLGVYPMDNNAGFEASAAGFTGDKTALNAFLNNAVANRQISESYKNTLLAKYG